MEWGFVFFLNSILFGVGLAMDAFSVSMANGLNEPDMPLKREVLIAGTFAVFQIIMPLAGWVCVRYISSLFESFSRWIPWIALLLLLYIGGKMLIEGIRKRGGEEESTAVGFAGLMLQGIATSIDALSVGFTISELGIAMAVSEALIIGLVTFFICIAGLRIGRAFGTKLSKKASILGGSILIAIGIEIFITGIF